jgi:hypothetical protein
MSVVVVVVGTTTVVVVGAAVVVVGAAVVVVGAAVVVGPAVVVVGAAVVVVELPSQTKAPPGELLPVHASQQLVDDPRHETPPSGGWHLSALFLIEHRTLPRRSTRQHVTAPSLPHVDLAAQRMSSLLHSWGNEPMDARCFATSPTHFTYCPWFDEPVQSHASAASRAFARAASSLHFFADATPGAMAPIATARTPIPNVLMKPSSFVVSISDFTHAYAPDEFGPVHRCGRNRGHEG